MSKYTTAQEQLDALSAPFPIEEIRQREQGGQVLNYFESSTIMKRLLEVMGTNYSISTGRIERYVVDNQPRRVDMEVIVRLIWVDGTETSITGWGSADIQYSKTDNWRIVSDFMKVANTDGIKICLSKLGVGAALYDSNYRKDMVEKKESEAKDARNKAMFTCADCGGEIVSGQVGKRTFTPEDVVKETRIKYKKRICLNCVAKLEKGGV